MQITLRPNPKTTGWARRIALAVLVGAGTILVTLPVAFILFLNHYQRVTPNDAQNLLAALTAGILVALFLGLGSMVASLAAVYLMRFIRPASR